MIAWLLLLVAIVACCWVIRWGVREQEKEDARLTEEERNKRWWDSQW